MGVGLGPDDEDIGDRRVRDPHLRSGQLVARRGLFGACFHRARIGPRVRFGQAETANQVARTQARQVFFALVLRAVGIDRVDHQRALHRHHRPVSAVHPFDFARDQTIGDVSRAQPAVFFGHGHAQQPGLAHFGKDFGRDGFFGIGLNDARGQFCVGKGACGVAQHAFIFAQLVFDAKGIFPVEPTQVRGVFGFQRGSGHRMRPFDQILRIVLARSRDGGNRGNPYKF